MEQEILNALLPHFPDIKGKITLEETTDRYNGHILSQSFKGLSFLDRQQRVFDILNANLGEETQRISMLFTYTPSEYEELQAA